MFGFFNKNRRLSIIVSPYEINQNKILFEANENSDKEILALLLILYTRIYRLCLINPFSKTYSHHLNTLFLEDIKKLNSFEKIINLIQNLLEINSYNKASKSKITLKKGGIYYAYISSLSSKNPNVYFYSAFLLLSHRVSNKELLVSGCQSLAEILADRKISSSEVDSIPNQIIQNY